MLSHILTINGGSSSIKFALFAHVLFETPLRACSSLQRLINGSIDRIGFSDSIFSVKGTATEENFSRQIETRDIAAASNILVTWLHEKKFSLAAIGHRIIHGGPRYYQPERITSEMLQKLQVWSLLDPEHSPGTLFLIKGLQKEFSDIPHIACFDTAFHHDMPRVAQLLPIPRSYEKEGIRRYGFHGLSCSFLMEELARLTKEKELHGKIILAHLGNGVSLTAVHHGKSIDTSMGFSPTSGMMMGTRSGNLDPSLSVFLEKFHGMSSSDFQAMTNKYSGLLGVSETSSDLRDLLAREKEDVRAAEAIALFCYQIKKEIGSLSAALQGLDTLIFTGGIGEHSSLIRERICDGLSFLGIKLDHEQNKKNALLISSKEAPVKVRVIPTDEVKWTPFFVQKCSKISLMDGAVF